MKKNYLNRAGRDNGIMSRDVSLDCNMDNYEAKNRMNWAIFTSQSLYCDNNFAIREQLTTQKL